MNQHILFIGNDDEKNGFFYVLFPFTAKCHYRHSSSNWMVMIDLGKPNWLLVFGVHPSHWNSCRLTWEYLLSLQSSSRCSIALLMASRYTWTLDQLHFDWLMWVDLRSEILPNKTVIVRSMGFICIRHQQQHHIVDDIRFDSFTFETSFALYFENVEFFTSFRLTRLKPGTVFGSFTKYVPHRNEMNKIDADYRLFLVSEESVETLCLSIWVDRVVVLPVLCLNVYVYTSCVEHSRQST